MSIGLYFIGIDPDKGPTKIGISADPTRRRKQLQNAQSELLTLFVTIWMSSDNSAAKAEKWLLEEYFKADRLQGEWISKGARRAYLPAMLAISRKFHGRAIDGCETIWDIFATDDEVRGSVKPRHGAITTAEEIERLSPNGGFPGDDRTPISS